MAFWHRTPSRGRAQDSGNQNACQERAGRIYLRGAMRHLKGRVGFEPTTPGLTVRDSCAELAASGHQGSPAKVRDGVAADEASPDDLPQKHKLYRLAIRAGTCRGLSIRTPWPRRSARHPHLEGSKGSPSSVPSELRMRIPRVADDAHRPPATNSIGSAPTGLVADDAVNARDDFFAGGAGCPWRRCPEGLTPPS
jgi:hypothetical protein